MTTTDTAQSGTETAAPAASKTHPCACLTGTKHTCDRTTQKAFAQGHDARMASRLAEAVAKDETTVEAAEELIRKAGGSDLLVGKMKRSAELRKQAKDRPAKPRATKKDKAEGEGEHVKATTEEAKAVASAGNGLLGSTVKVFHKEKEYDAAVVRNAAGDMIARHRLIGRNCDHEVDAEGHTGAPIK